MKKPTDAAKRTLGLLGHKVSAVPRRRLSLGIPELDQMRGGNHSKDIREYVITEKGLVIIHPRRTDYYGLLTGIPRQTGPRRAQQDESAPEPRATL